MNKHPDFITASWQDLPESDLPEIALLGRSNVGKSSFINALIGRSRAKTSQTPGKTQTINGYCEKTHTIVDLPGFGYAKSARHARAKWQQMCENYLEHRPGLMGVFHLIDMRHEWQAVDIDISSLISALELPCLVVLTKSDKLKRNDVRKQLQYYTKSLNGLYRSTPDILMTSSKDKSGFNEVNETINRWLDAHS